MPTLYPSAIVSQSGLYGSLAALADDPADPDASWMTVSDPHVGSTWYVRPTGTGTNGDGTSYATAWRGYAAIQWVNLQPGDTLYVAGTHYYSGIRVGASGSSGSPIVIASCETAYGASTDDPGVIWAGQRYAPTFTDLGDGLWSTARAGNITSNLMVEQHGSTIRVLKVVTSTPLNDGEFWDNSGTLYVNSSVRPDYLYYTIVTNPLCALHINEKSYITVKGLGLYMSANSPNSAAGALTIAPQTMTNAPHHIVIEDCSIGRSGNAYGVQTNAKADNTQDSTDITLRNCVIFDCRAGMYHEAGQGDRFTIDGCEFYRHANYPWSNVSDEGAINVQSGVDNFTITDNHIHDWKGHGINLYLGSSIGTWTMNDCLIDNNVIAIDASDPTRYNGGIWMNGTNSHTFTERWAGCEITNNQISGAGNPSASASILHYQNAIRVKSDRPTSAGDIPVITGNTITDCFIGLYLRNSGLPEYNIGNIIAGSSTVVVLSDAPHPFVAGDSVTLAGIAAPFNSVNGNRSITLVDGDQITISFDTSGVGGSYVPAADTMKYASGTDGQLSMLEHCGTYTGNTISDPKTGGYFVYGENGSTYADLDMDQNAYSGTGKWKWDGGTDSTTFAAWKEAADPRDANSTYEA